MKRLALRLTTTIGILLTLVAVSAQRQDGGVRLDGVTQGATVNNPTFTGQVKSADGTAALPAFTWTSAPTYGWYNAGSGAWGYAHAGVAAWIFTSGNFIDQGSHTLTAGGNITAGNFLPGTAASSSLGTAAGTRFGNLYVNTVLLGNGAANVAGGSGANQILFTDPTSATGFGAGVGTDGTFILRNRGFTAGTGNLDVGAKITAYNGVTTAGWGVPAIQGAGAPGSTVNVGVASIATYTNGAADGDFEVSATCLVTVSTTHSFSLDVVYTDTSNVSRTMTLPVNQLAGTFITTGLITNVTGAGNYESAVLHISAKASTSITIRTSAGGTFTTVTYFPRAVIRQIA